MYILWRVRKEFFIDIFVGKITFMIFSLDQICGDTCLHYGENDLNNICQDLNLTNTECQKRKSEFYGDTTKWCKCGNKPPKQLNGVWKKWSRYCCNTMPCERIADENGIYNTIHCKNGTVKSITEQCGLNDCPTAKIVSSSALSINEGVNSSKIIEQ